MLKDICRRYRNCECDGLELANGTYWHKPDKFSSHASASVRALTECRTSGSLATVLGPRGQSDTVILLSVVMGLSYLDEVGDSKQMRICRSRSGVSVPGWERIPR
jgi:hypothetical protein